jgi:hypothetical protein
MNYYKAYKMLITGVNEYIADGVYDPEVTLAEKYKYAIDRILDQGIVYDISGEISTYAIGSVETYLKYDEALGFQSDYSVFASVETYLKAAEAHLPIRQNKLFLPSINRLRVLDEGMDRVLDKGVAESGDWSLILRFVRDCKKWADLGGINVTEFSIIIDTILDKGIVFSQFTENSATISSVETYLKLAEVQGLTQA